MQVERSGSVTNRRVLAVATGGAQLSSLNDDEPVAVRRAKGVPAGGHDVPEDRPRWPRTAWRRTPPRAEVDGAEVVGIGIGPIGSGGRMPLSGRQA
jgi:hypothetical protein